MPSFRVFIASSIFLCFLPLADGQSVYGNTTISVDPSTNDVTATCETSMDASLEGAYDVSVDCSVVDDHGNQVASGGQSAPSSDDNSAQVTLTFTGVPGTTYTATGTHYGTPVMPYYDPDGGDPNPIWLGGGGSPGSFDDPFNFASFGYSPQTYPNSYDWYGPGPDEEASGAPLQVGSTTASASLAGPPFAMKVFSDNGNQHDTGCPSGQNPILRNIRYQVIDAHGVNAALSYPIGEEVAAPISTCDNKQDALTAACGGFTDTTGKFTDSLSVSYCSTKPNNSCGLSLTPDIWKACVNNNHIKIGTPTYVVQWNTVTIDDSTQLSSGTPIPNQ